MIGARLMARNKTTRKLTGRALRRYFDMLLETEQDVSSGPRRRLADLLHLEVAQVRVRTPLAVRRKYAQARSPSAFSDAVEVVEKPAAPVPVSPSPTPQPAFNPYAFSAVVVMTKGGAEALLARLSKISDMAHLRRLASAQHIGVPQDGVTIDELRAAIVDGAAHRIADRRAAAS
jgi:hypothetical protein